MYRKAKELTIQSGLLAIALVLVPAPPLNVAGYCLGYLWPWMFLATVVLYCVDRRKS